MLGGAMRRSGASSSRGTGSSSSRRQSTHRSRGQPDSYEDDQQMEEDFDEEEDSQAMGETEQALEMLGGKDFFNSQQTEEQRRVIRAEYRELLSITESNRSEITAQQLIDTVGRAGQLFQQVFTTHEATLDSKVLVAAADLAVQKAQRMRLDGGTFNIDDWLGKVVITMNGNAQTIAENEDEVEDDDEEEADVRGGSGAGLSRLDWSALGKAATMCLRRVPTIDFMLGPLAVEQTVRTQRRKAARLVKNKEDLQKPQQLGEKDFQKQENETTALVKEIYMVLQDLGTVPFFEFIVNPESFGQTVENLFYVSFLIRDGKVQVHEDEDDGELMLDIADPPSDENGGDAQRYQAVVDIDMPTWRDLIEAYNITSSCIPTREKSNFVAQSGRWYG
ncbi:Nse4 C-terminal-domain-containing protein [Fimicolochytrium jonesii]|uniref:Nse4 C-terminal-domain-containing protein n=1 Tax=Fimicolochytrium jonesii TaxID=1396493 RepID=UPI0022FDB296|nr:Nse4 C-terminal-domain-containing protein [Fimicolochytrium jonesii]KAI8815592.1 Nse4 C-terminal-domain-containing protein [Fimicolochytrium jonesii]